MKACLLVAVGGALGAVGRHLVTVAATAWLGSGFPWGTLIVNVAGSFLLGVLVALLSAVWTPPGEVRLFLVTGFLGAFTTFSAFSLDVVSEFERGHNSLAILYVVASVVLSVLALLAGLRLMRLVLA
ncbi:MAG: fluoride efflux transporter CrcB [Alphaproteobacteria bacterium]|nr:fluoride efflux transporter CrcB [Alphaproteobacteria bacterium]